MIAMEEMNLLLCETQICFKYRIETRIEPLSMSCVSMGWRKSNNSGSLQRSKCILGDRWIWLIMNSIFYQLQDGKLTESFEHRWKRLATFHSSLHSLFISTELTLPFSFSKLIKISTSWALVGGRGRCTCVTYSSKTAGLEPEFKTNILSTP